MVTPTPSLVAFLVLIGLVVLERIYELRLARRNARAMIARGGAEVAAGHYPWMVALHTAWIVAAPLEAWLLGRPFIISLGWPMLGLVVSSMALRYWAIRSLGDRWTTRVVVVPDESAIRRGPYLAMRHPNYLAVVVEIFALPLVHTAWLTALVFSLLNAWLLRVRIGAEERALAEISDYDDTFGGVPRMFGPSKEE